MWFRDKGKTSVTWHPKADPFLTTGHSKIKLPRLPLSSKLRSGVGERPENFPAATTEPPSEQQPPTPRLPGPMLSRPLAAKSDFSKKQHKTKQNEPRHLHKAQHTQTVGGRLASPPLLPRTHRRHLRHPTGLRPGRLPAAAVAALPPARRVSPHAARRGRGREDGPHLSTPVLTFRDLKLGRSIELVEAPVNRAVAWGAANWAGRKGTVSRGDAGQAGTGLRKRESREGGGVEKQSRRSGEERWRGRGGNGAMKRGLERAGGGRAFPDTLLVGHGCCPPKGAQCSELLFALLSAPAARGASSFSQRSGRRRQPALPRGARGAGGGRTGRREGSARSSRRGRCSLSGTRRARPRRPRRGSGRCERRGPRGLPAGPGGSAVWGQPQPRRDAAPQPGLPPRLPPRRGAEPPSCCRCSFGPSGAPGCAVSLHSAPGTGARGAASPAPVAVYARCTGGRDAEPLERTTHQGHAGVTHTSIHTASPGSPCQNRHPRFPRNIHLPPLGCLGYPADKGCK